MILRRFYITENTKGWDLVYCGAMGSLSSLLAPVPKSKANRVLKTEIQPLANTEPVCSRVICPIVGIKSIL